MLALTYAPATFRNDFEGLFSFDARLGACVASVNEPQLGLIRLAWWREQIAVADDTRKAVDPDLEHARGLTRRRDVTPAHLLRIIDGWSALLDPLPLTPKALGAYASGRGGGLYAAAAAITALAPIGSAGEAFALVDFAIKCSDPVSTSRALSLVQDMREVVSSRALRPFALLDDWARRDAARLLSGRPPISLQRRALSALTFGLTGPRSRTRS